jgi:LmbE family N-acetylglucosaminyl deacetylase
LIWAAPAPAAQQDLPPITPEISRATRLLVFAPHPDDEALGAAGLIARVRARGGAVQVVVLTSGDGYPGAVEAVSRHKDPKPADYRNFGLRREAETRAAMLALGVPSNRITFLGFPDEGLCLLASTYLFDKRRAFESPYTDRVRPPATEQIVRGAKYRGVDVRLEMERVVAAFAPNLVVLPHPDDDHPDHCSTHLFWRAPTPDLKPPSGFPPSEGRWVSLALTPREAAVKERAILTYSTQMQIIGRFMRAFARNNELFLEGDPASLPECWCDGQNVATEAPPSKYRRRR